MGGLYGRLFRYRSVSLVPLLLSLFALLTYADQAFALAVNCADCHKQPVVTHSAQHDKTVVTRPWCATCHDGNVKIEHTDKRQIACEKCHILAYDAVIAKGVGGINVNCNDCHVSADHLVLHDQVSNVTPCQECHADSLMVLHKDNCEACHTSTNSSVINTINIGKGATGSPVNCTNCHALHAGTDHNMLSASSNCTSCHTIASFEAILTTHSNSCFTCHSSTRSDVVTTITQGRAGVSVNCENCHGVHNGVTDHNNLSTTANCSSCHATASLDAILVTHLSSCATCHSSARPEVTVAINNGKNGLPVNCENCHTAHDGNLAHNNLEVAPNCGQCHFNIIYGELHNSNCATCHSSTDPVVMATINLGRGPTGTKVNCDNCHAGHATDHNYLSTVIDCSGCHNTTGTFQEIWGLHQNVCGTCHNIASTDPMYLQVTTTITSGMLNNPVNCKGCHSPHDGTVVHNNLSTSVNCSNCHMGSTFVEINGIHNNDCAKCHSSLRPDVQTTINAGKGASGIPVNCENCHTGHTGAVHNNLSTAQPCSTCHDTADFDAIYTVHGSDCLTCHASTNNQMVKDTINRGAGADGLAVDCISCHGNLDHNSVHNKTLLPPDGCTNCHVADVKVEHVDKHALGCVTCHSSIDPKVQAAIVKGMGLNGKDVYCADCHIGTNHNAAHDQTFVPDAACSTCHYQDVATEHVNKRGLDCLVCHGNTTFDQIIDSGMSDNLPGPVPVYCTTCHNPVVNHDTAHSNTAVPSTSCSTCHSADVGVVHVTERKLSCSVCHENSAYSSVINHAAGVTVTCAQCHGTITDHNSAHDNALIDTDGCVKCHAADVVVEHVTNRALTCFTCHSSIDPTVMQTIATGKSGTAVYCTTCHVTQTGHSSAHDMTVLPNTTCADCHAANVVTEHVDKRGIACSLCHSSTNTDIISAIATGKAGSPVNCYACHPAVDHKADHNMVAFPTTQAIGCTTCHDVNVVGEHVEKRALSCLVCHNNPAYAAAIASGIAGTVVTCDQCHGQPQHHLSSDAQNGLCVKCHTVSAEYKDAPVQGPCRQCHINTSNFVQGLNPTRVVHAYNTLGKISDFGACVACHVPRSSTFKPFHAKPTVGRQPTDPSIAVPGRGTFNLFYSEFNRSREGGEGSRWGSEDRNYKNQQQAWSQPAISYNMLVVSHAGVSYTVPTFDVPPPTIISLDKTSSFVGTTVKITGTKFGATKGTSYVLFGTAAQVLDGTATKVTTSAWSDTNISFVVPSNTIGTWYLKVVVNNVSSNTKTFAIVSPTITSLDKTSGRVGTIVKITGTNFGVTKGTSYIMFGTQSQLAAGTATKVTTSSWSATSMNFTVPSKTRGVWYIKVVVNGVSSNIVSFTIS